MIDWEMPPCWEIYSCTIRHILNGQKGNFNLITNMIVSSLLVFPFMHAIATMASFHWTELVVLFSSCSLAVTKSADSIKREQKAYNTCLTLIKNLL